MFLPSLGWGSDALEERLLQFNTHAKFPIPGLSESQLGKLREGKLVRMREVDSVSGSQRGIGLRIIEQPMAQLWVGAVDPHMTYKAAANEVEMTSGEGSRRWYQRLWLPWPFAHRHWVIDVQDSTALAKVTQDIAWEHYWTLAPEGPTLAKALIAAGKVEGVSVRDGEGFVYTPENRGAYFAIALADGRTLWGFHAATVVGGNISDRMVTNFTMMQLRGIFQDVIERGLKAKTHYILGHEQVVGGNGEPIPLF